MSKKLAIKGHPTRGWEVIELLEMMGGKNTAYHGLDINVVYTIDDKGIIRSLFFNDSVLIKMEYEIFTIEEFLEKYPYKVGDKVPNFYENSQSSPTIKSMRWDENYETVIYEFKDSILFVRGEDLKPVDDVDNNHTKQSKMKNVLAELLEHIKTTPKEELEKEFKEIEEWSNVGPTVEEFMTFCETVNKKPFYPKTYEECCEVLMGKTNFSEFTLVPIKYSNTTKFDNSVSYDAPYIELFNNLYKIVICCDAYWKIAGEEMGLGKPWKPDWNDVSDKHCIYFVSGDIWLTECQTRHCTLAFPTAEIRDIFYENFKELIEQCMELL